MRLSHDLRPLVAGLLIACNSPTPTTTVEVTPEPDRTAAEVAREPVAAPPATPSTPASAVLIEEAPVEEDEAFEVDSDVFQVGYPEVGLPRRLTFPQDDASKKNPKVTWSSSRPSVATIDTKGVLWPKAPGTVIVTATAGGVQHRGTVRVVQASKDLDDMSRYALKTGVVADISSTSCAYEGILSPATECRGYRLRDGTTYVLSDGGCQWDAWLELDTSSFDVALAKLFAATKVPARARTLPLKALWLAPKAPEQETVNRYPGNPKLRVDTGDGWLSVIVPDEQVRYTVSTRGKFYSIGLGDWVDWDGSETPSEER